MPIKIVPTKKKKKSKKGGGGMDIGRPAKTKEIPMSRTMSLIKKEPAIKGYLRGGSVKKASGSIKKARMVIPMQPEKAKEKKKTTKKKPSGASPFIMPGQKKMLDRMTGKSKPQTLKGGGGLKAVPQGNKGKGLSKLPTEVRNKMGYMKKGGKVTSNKAKLNKVTSGLKKAVKAHTGQAKMLSSIKLNKGGKIMKMRGGGAATRGLMFNNR